MSAIKRSDMSKMTTVARIHPDGVVAEALEGGGERPLLNSPVPSPAEAENRAATVSSHALADPDVQPMPPEESANVPRGPSVKTLRLALGLTQEDFAARYHIPIGTLRDWEQGRSEPDQPARAYIEVIASDPDWVSHALACGRNEQRIVSGQ
jgi:putative transcriptional regulator